MIGGSKQESLLGKDIFSLYQFINDYPTNVVHDFEKKYKVHYALIKKVSNFFIENHDLSQILFLLFMNIGDTNNDDINLIESIKSKSKIIFELLGAYALNDSDMELSEMIKYVFYKKTETNGGSILDAIKNTVGTAVEYGKSLITDTLPYCDEKLRDSVEILKTLQGNLDPDTKREIFTFFKNFFKKTLELFKKNNENINNFNVQQKRIIEKYSSLFKNLIKKCDENMMQLSINKN